MAERIRLDVNGRVHELQVEPGTPLLYVLRNDLGLTAAKFGCGLEQCGACTVVVDGEAMQSCRAAVASFEGRRITTLEGLAQPDGLHPLQRAFVEEQAAQCGYCIPGIIMAAKALLDRNPRASDVDIRQALAPNLCSAARNSGMRSAARYSRSAPRNIESSARRQDRAAISPRW